jgi:hypothetical protein
MSANFARSTTDLLHTRANVSEVKIKLETAQTAPASVSDEQPWTHLLTPRTIFRQRPHWQNPEESIGVECAPLGRHKCWEAIGRVREISRDIYRETKNILEQHTDFLHESETMPFSITFSLYMVGRKQSSANPTLIICCGPKKPRQKAIDLIRNSGILQDHPGVLLAGADRSPAISDQIRPLGDLGAANSNLIYFSPPRQYSVCGRSIYLIEESLPITGIGASIAQKATIGGFVRLRNSQYDDLYCGLTVAHAFMQGLESPQSDSEINFEFTEYYDEEDSEDEVTPHKGGEARKHFLLKPNHATGVKTSYTNWLSKALKTANKLVEAKIYQGVEILKLRKQTDQLL